MGLLDHLDLPRLTERRPGPQPKGPTRLDVKVAKDDAADKAWETCKRLVDKRDGVKCRICQRVTVITLELDPKRAEHAHIIRRSKEKALKYDVRNVFKTCLRCHQRFDKHEIEVMQKAVDMFEWPVGSGRKYLNADKPLTFVAKAA